jgi:prepilin-type N-terminal cleavage/methylation domain-containing protein
MRTINNRLNLRHGYTLIELMMVLSVITILVATSLPAVRSPMAKSTLRTSAKDLRSELSRARLRAIETGLVLHFRYKEGTSEYEIVPQNSEFSEDLWSEAVVEDLESPSQTSSLSAIDTVTVEDEVVSGELAEGVRFMKTESEDAGFETVISEEADDEFASVEEEPLSEGSFDDDSEWSEPIVFYPNGRISQSRIRLEGENHIQVDLNVRGLTGNVSVSDLKKSDIDADEDVE